MKINTIKLVIVLIFTLLFVSCSNSDINIAEIIGTNKMKVDYYRASFVIDETDLTQVTTYSSYVFVANVVSYERTEYLNDDGDTPLTFYSIRVLENIKGNLRTDEDIELKKSGGLLKDRDTFSLCEGDILPEVGKTYLFATVIFDSDLYCPMPNMVVELDSTNTKWSENVTVQQYMEACEKEDENVPNGNQFTSKFDAGVK